MNDTKASNAILDGYDGPFFPDLLADFMASQDTHDIHNSFSMTELAKSISVFSGGDIYQTSDNYYWYFGLHFKSDSGEMVILLPDIGDLNTLTGRMERVRSVAVYTSGIFSVDDVLQQLISGIKARAEHLSQVEATRKAGELKATDAVLDKFPDLKRAFEEFDQKTHS